MPRIATRDVFAAAERSDDDVRRRAAALVLGAWIHRGHGDARGARAVVRACDFPPLVPDVEGAAALVAPPAHDDARWLGALYEGALARGPRSGRRRTGVHYTPGPLADEVTRTTLRAIDPDAIVRGAHVLDLAVGTGAFLLAARGALVEAAAIDARDIARLTRDFLHGIDVDPYAVLVARLALSVGTTLAPQELVGIVVGDAVASTLTERPWSTLLPRAPGGFDVVVSNPPYVGGKRIRTHFGDAYASRLARREQPLSRNADLAAHFLRRGYEVLRPGGVLGFVTTNTISQGATREAGLGLLVREGAIVFDARTRVPWPGDAAVVATTICLARPRTDGEPQTIARVLDGEPVGTISALLTSTEGHRQPPRIPDRTKIAFIGCFVRGMGFTFDDESVDATPLAEMARILRDEPESREAIFPYLGGAEVSQDPAQRHHRYVIFFGDASIDEVRRRWPALHDIVSRRVRPHRERLRETAADVQHARAWWRFANDRTEMRSAVSGLDHVVVVPRVSPHVIAARVPTGAIFSDQLVVVASDCFGMWGLLQSQLHATWAWRMSSTLGDGLRYTPRTAIDTLVFPASFEGMKEPARALEDARRRQLLAHRIGLTELYNAFHDPSSSASWILELRALSEALELSVLDAYGIDAPRSFGFAPAAAEPRKRIRYGLSPVALERVVAHLFAIGDQVGGVEASRARAQAVASATLANVAVGAGARTSQ